MKRRVKKRKAGPLLVIHAALGDGETRKLVREMLKRADRHIAKKRDELALETVRALRNAMEPRPITITNCYFSG